MFDALIREAAERFDLGEKARTFVGLLIGLIFNKGSGGFQGLQRRFAAAELDGLFASWVDATVADNVFQPDQFSAVIGNDEVTRIARRLGFPMQRSPSPVPPCCPNWWACSPAAAAFPTPRQPRPPR